VPFEVVEDLMQMQPNHQLAETAEIVWALSVISDAWDSNYGTEAQKRMGRVKDLKLPTALRNYLEQYRLAKEHESQLPNAN